MKTLCYLYNLHFRIHYDCVPLWFEKLHSWSMYIFIVIYSENMVSPEKVKFCCYCSKEHMELVIIPHLPEFVAPVSNYTKSVTNQSIIRWVLFWFIS